jgi:hypothetical protein
MATSKDNEQIKAPVTFGDGTVSDTSAGTSTSGTEDLTPAEKAVVAKKTSKDRHIQNAGNGYNDHANEAQAFRTSKTIGVKPFPETGAEYYALIHPTE